MATTHTPAAARKLGLRALILFAIGGAVAAWWVWAVSLGQLARLIDMAHGTTWRAMVDDPARGLGFISQAHAQESDRDAFARIKAEAERRYPLPQDVREPYRLKRNDPAEYERQMKATEDAARAALEGRERYITEQLRQHQRDRQAGLVRVGFITEAKAQGFVTPPPDPADTVEGVSDEARGLQRSDIEHAQRMAKAAPVGHPSRTYWEARAKASASHRIPHWQNTEYEGRGGMIARMDAAEKDRAAYFARVDETTRQLMGAAAYDAYKAAPEATPGQEAVRREAWAELAKEATKPTPTTAEPKGPDKFLPPSVAAQGPAQGEPPRKPCTFGPGDCPDWEALAKQGQAPTTSAEAERRAANAAQAPEAAEAPQSAPNPLAGSLAGVDVQKVRVWSLLGACVVLALWVLMGGKFAAVRKPAFIPPRFFFLSVPLVGVYAASFLVSPGAMTPTLWPAVLAFVPPLAFFVGPVYYVAGFDWLKETAFYRRWLVRGRGFEVARLGGIKAYMQRDITNYSDLNRSAIVRTHYSPLFIGGTLGPLDYKLGGRDIGTVSEQHMVTAAGSGAGKSRDAIFNNLAQYCGGVVAFDTKGELARFAYERRSAYAPFHVIAPWDGTNESDPLGLPLAYWNPLDSIDANGIAARDLIARMCEALIVPDGKDSGNSAHFREMAQMILRGYIAHVKTQYPPEQQHLGTVYDLFKRGAPGETTFDPEKVAQIVLDMADNPACGSTPADAAQAFLMLEDREKSGVVSSITRAVDWMGSPVLKAYFSKPSTVNLIDCKTKDASAFLVIPSMYKGTMRGLLRLFYQVAFDQLDEINTRQPAGSGRRVLFLFDEFASLGSFKAAVEAANLKRASFIKCWYIVQNFGQFSALYENPRDFLSNCDKQIFGMDRMDTDTIDIIRKALGSYTDTRGDVHEVKSVMSEGDITETLDGESGEQLFIPMMGAPMVLSRVPYFERLQPWPLRAWGAVKRMMPRPL
jgi:hypothetical protein